MVQSLEMSLKMFVFLVLPSDQRTERMLSCKGEISALMLSAASLEPARVRPDVSIFSMSIMSDG